MPRSTLYGKPRQFHRASEKIAEGMAAIATGRSAGQYPALDRILSQKDVCTPTCQHRINSDLERQLIQDVTPPLGERLAVVEHIATELDKKFEQHRQESIRAGLLYATKEELGVVDKHVDKLEAQNTTKTMILVVTVIGLLLSITYNVINIYKNFHL